MTAGQFLEEKPVSAPSRQNDGRGLRRMCITSKVAAADWALQRLPRELKSVVIAARDAYLGLEAADLAAYPKERADLRNHIHSSVTAKLQ